MRGLDHFKTVTIETGGNRNVVPTQNATNLIEWKEIKQNSVSTRSLINRICKSQATFYGHVMKREKLGDLVTTGMIEVKHRG